MEYKEWGSQVKREAKKYIGPATLALGLFGMAIMYRGSVGQMLPLSQIQQQEPPSAGILKPVDESLFEPELLPASIPQGATVSNGVKCNGDSTIFNSDISWPNDPEFKKPGYPGLGQAVQFRLPWMIGYEASYQCENPEEREYWLVQEIQRLMYEQGEKLVSATIFVIDSGISPQPDLSSVDYAGSTDATGGNDPIDRNGHGTQMMSIIAADTDNDLQIAGRTFDIPSLEVKSIKGTTSTGSTNDTYIGNALQLVWEYKIAHPEEDIGLNISLGSSRPYTPTYAVRLNDLIDLGVVVFASSGNQSNKLPSVTPANLEGVISVGCIYPYFLDLTPCPSTNFPGINGVVNPGSSVYAVDLDGTVIRRSGTSHATAVATGQFWMLRSLFPDLSINEFKQMYLGARKNIDVEPEELVKWGGMVDILSLLEARYQQLLSDVPTETPSPTPTETPTETGTAIPTHTQTPIPTETPTPISTRTDTPTPTETLTPTSSPSPTETPTETVVITPIPTLIPTPKPPINELFIPLIKAQSRIKGRVDRYHSFAAYFREERNRVRETIRVAQFSRVGKRKSVA